jgi:hypothetical protein
MNRTDLGTWRVPVKHPNCDSLPATEGTPMPDTILHDSEVAAPIGWSGDITPPA